MGFPRPLQWSFAAPLSSSASNPGVTGLAGTEAGKAVAALPKGTNQHTD